MREVAEKFLMFLGALFLVFVLALSFWMAMQTEDRLGVICADGQRTGCAQPVARGLI